MPVVVEVKSKADYANWVTEQKKKASAAVDDPAKQWTMADLMARGQQVYMANCAACHQPTGQGVPNAFPALAGSKVVQGPKEAQILLVLHGKPNTAMASFKQLSDTELAAVVTYTRNSWGNASGEAQPAEVQTARAK